MSDSTGPLRVLALMDSSILSGPGRQLGAVAQALRPHGVNVRVVMTRRGNRPSSPLAKHLASLGVECLELSEAFAFDPSLLFRLRSLIRRWDPEIIQTHGYKPTAMMAALRVLGVRRPWIGFFHGATAEDFKVRAYNALDRFLMHRADEVVVVARSQLKRFPRARQIRVLDNAVLASVEPLRQVAGASAVGKSWRLGVAARLSPEKGVDVLLDAALKLKQERFPFLLLIAGDGPESEALRQRASHGALDGTVEFLGAVRDMNSFYADIDALVIPSRSEGLPNVLLEALAAGLPVVATRVGAVPDVLGDSTAGILVNPGDVVALADACSQLPHLSTNPTREAARRAILDRFSLNRRTSEHLALYAEVLNRTRLAADQ